MLGGIGAAPKAKRDAAAETKFAAVAGLVGESTRRPRIYGLGIHAISPDFFVSEESEVVVALRMSLFVCGIGHHQSTRWISFH